MRSEELGMRNTQILFIPSVVLFVPDLGIFVTSGGTFRTRVWYEILKEKRWDYFTRRNRSL